MGAAGPRKTLLLVEPNSLFRRTVALVARELDLADICEASSHETAQKVLERQRFDGLLIDMDDGLIGLGLLQAVRCGATRCGANLPVAVMSATVDPAAIAMFKELDVRRVMVKPFKVKTVLDVLATLASPAPPSATGAD